MGLYRFLASARELKEFESDKDVMKINTLTDLTETSNYTDKKNCASFEWNYSEKNAEILISRIKEHLRICPRIELWSTKLGENKNVIMKKCSKNILTIDNIKEIFGHDNLEQPQCLVIYNA